MNIRLKYNHPATPRNGIMMNVLYLLGKDEKGFFLQHQEAKIYMELPKIKVFFKITHGEDEFEKLFEQKKPEFTPKKSEFEPKHSKNIQKHKEKNEE